VALTEQGFAEFYRRHSRSLWTYVYRVTSHTADADDIVQEALLRVARVDLEGEEDYRRYLFRVAGNLIADRWRRSTREELRPEAIDEEAQAVPERDDRADDVARTFEMLKPRDRALLWLAYVEQEDHVRIAQSLRISRGSVKVLLSRARARLRDLLAARGLRARNS
jgi:RNA polymerase sigma-70 factor (ECF subfamily)